MELKRADLRGRQQGRMHKYEVLSGFRNGFAQKGHVAWSVITKVLRRKMGKPKMQDVKSGCRMGRLEPGHKGLPHWRKRSGMQRAPRTWHAVEGTAHAVQSPENSGKHCEKTEESRAWDRSGSDGVTNRGRGATQEQMQQKPHQYLGPIK